MWFVQKFQTGTRWESSEVFAIDKVPQDEQEFINKNGYPVEPYIIGEDEEILASPNEIGWWDEGEETDEYRDVTINDVNMIINEFDGEIAIDGDLYGYDDDDEDCEYPEDKFFATLYADKVILSFPEYDDEWEYDYFTDQNVWELGVIVNTVPQSDENGPFLEHWVELDEEYFIVLTDTDNQLLHPESEAVIINEEI
jgi:hypothetical protein